MTDLTSILHSASAGTSQQVMLVNAVLFLAIFAYVLRSQFRIRPVTSRRFLLIAILFLYGLCGGVPAAALGVALFVASVGVSIGFGVWRGRSMRIWRGTDGLLYRRGTALTITLWVITVTTKFVLDGVELAATHTFTVGPIWLAMALTLAVQQYVMLHRAKSLATT